MEKLTAIVPTGNEAHNIEAVLESVSFADEIMVVDSFSTDNTVGLARKHTDFIIQREYEYAASQKNWAIPQATHEWILLVDADERITPELRVEIQDVLKNGSDKAGYWIFRDNLFMGRQLKNSGIKGDKCIRLFRKSLCRYEDKHVHEEIIANGEVSSLKNRMLHDTYVNIDAFYAKMNRYATWQAKDYLKSVKRVTCYHLWLKPSFRFFKHYILGLGFLDGFEGYVYAITQKHAVRMRYIKLKVLLQQNAEN
jgi:glycosyltransferase involved in cell wall biosynthesis